MVCGHSTAPTRERLLVLQVDVDFKTLLREQKNYPWQRPWRCQGCGGARQWGHGYVSRFFDAVAEPVWLKRYRCPECGAVHLMRARLCWRGFWASRATIVKCLRDKANGRRWDRSVSRQRQQYWWRGLLKQRALAGLLDLSPEAALARMLATGLIAATHSTTHRERRLVRDGPYRIFAVTAPG